MNQQPQISLDQMKNATTIKCEKCENETFEEVLKLKKLSKIYTGQNKDTLIPIPLFVCKKCGHINSEFDINNEN